MSIQAQLNNQALSMLPKISSAISNSESFESNQMYCSAIKACLNTQPCLDDKTPEQLAEFDADMVDYFKKMGWIA